MKLQNMIDFLKNIKEKISEHDQFDDQFEKLMIIDDFYISMIKYEYFDYKKDYVYKSAK